MIDISHGNVGNILVIFTLIWLIVLVICSFNFFISRFEFSFVCFITEFRISARESGVTDLAMKK